MNEPINHGIWWFCGLVCGWPIFLSVLSVLLYRKISAHGWDSLVPGWFKRLPPYE